MNQGPPPDDARLRSAAATLAWVTVLFNLAEGAASLAYGARDGSLSLAGFGADSLIEVGSAALVLWRLRGLGEERERTATRAIGGLLVALAAATFVAAALELRRRAAPATTVPGVVICLLSAAGMLALWRRKLGVGRALGNESLLADAACSRSCLQLSAAVLLASAVYAAVPAAWWADAAAAALLSLLIAREGLELYRGEGCGSSCGA